MAAFVGEKPYPLSSDFWNQLLELPLTLQWPQDRVLQACQLFGQWLAFHFHSLFIEIIPFLGLWRGLMLNDPLELISYYV